jgi:4-hydroxy 2-oxovalerate aldolase
MNLMQVSRYPRSDLSVLGAQLAKWDSLDVLYFADSLGNMTEDDIRDRFAALRDGWPGEIGVHAHDNRGRALDNTLAALDAGATWIDATILGMGRGAGNPRTELLLFELQQLGAESYRPEALLAISSNDFPALQQEYGWGTNLLYFMSAAYGVHPTYVQLMQSESRYDDADVVVALEALRDMEGHSFSADRLAEALTPADADEHGAWSAAGWLEGQDVLILGPGPGLAEHAEGIRRFVERHHPAVLTLNTVDFGDEQVTAHVACHPTRILMEWSRFEGLGTPLVVPSATLQAVAGRRLSGVHTLDFGLRVAPDEFSVHDDGCVLPTRLAVAYAMALATAAGARRIFLAGFDGFAPGDARQEEMVEMFGAYQAMPSAIPILAITPTTYPIPQGSVYAPLL